MALSIVYAVAVILLLILVLALGFKPKYMVRITGGVLVAAVICGMILYGYGYWALSRNIPQTIVSALFSVLLMFLGENEIGTISSVPGLQTHAAQLCIYTVHLLALYTTVSAVITAVGTRLIRTLSLTLIRRDEIHVIYGANEDSVAFGEALQEEKQGVVVFVDSGGGEALDGKILRMGSILLTEQDDKIPTAAFLKKIGLKPGDRHVSVYCLDENPAENLRFAEALRTALAAGGFQAEQSSLTILLEDASGGPALQATGNTGGFGSVLAVDRPEMLARLMIQTKAPWETIAFDETGCARADFEALVVGFGRTGQAALRSLIANGQFEGSHFRAAVVARNVQEQSGSFFYRYPGLRSEYEIQVLEEDARSASFYAWLEQRCVALKYVAICAGDDRENREIANELRDYFRLRDVHPEILLCAPGGVSHMSGTDAGQSVTELYSTKVLCVGALDRVAMLLNHQYHSQEGHTPQQDWAACDYFSRMSCRASADFMDAFLRAAGTDRTQCRRDGWSLSPELLENLSRTEHLRWCAFHLAMGYRPMPRETFDRRAAQYRQEVQEAGHSALRIGKDTRLRLHACLIPWEELDELSARETEITGKPVDYKEMDRDNVRLIPSMLDQSNQ